MMASLDSPLTKYHRAREHVETLRGQLSPLSDLKSYAIASDIDSKTGDQIRRFDHVPPMPSGIEVLIGEMLYNFRSSLDNLLWQLVLSKGNTPTTRNEFPIFKDSVRYDADKKNKLAGVSDTARTIIDGLQPCNSTGDNDYWKHLWDLQVLNNADKHRHLLFIRHTLHPILRVQFGSRIPRGLYLEVPVEKGAIFFRGEPNVEMDVKPRIDILFSNAPADIRGDLSVLTIIGVIFDSVDEVFRRLRPHVK